MAKNDNAWTLERFMGPWHLLDEAAEWILPYGLNLDNVKCKEKFSGTSFTYLEVERVFLLVEEDLIQNTHVTNDSCTCR